MIPYAPSTPYQRNATVADLMMQAGNQQAQAQLQKGAVWGRALGNIGDIASGAILDYQKQKAQAPIIAAKLADEQSQRQARDLGTQKTQMEIDQMQRDQAQGEMLKSLYADPANPPTLNKIASIVGPERAAAIIKLHGVADPTKQYKDVSELLRDGLLGVAALPESARPEGYKITVDSIRSRGIPVDQIAPPEYDANSFARLLNYGQAPKAEGDGARVVGRSLVGKDGKVIYRDPEPTKEAPKPGDNKDDVSFLMNGGTAEKLPISARAAAVAEAKKSGGVDGTGFVPMSGQQQNKFNDLMDLRNKAVRLSELLSNPEVSSRLGPLMGRVVDWTKELPGVGQDTTVKEAFDLFKDLSDSELRKRSGAAISPGEYQRILGFTVASSKQPDSNKTNLNRMISTLTRDLNTLGADKLRLPGEAEPLENGTRVQAPAPAVKPPDTVTYQGKTVPFSSLPPELQAVVMKARASGGR